MTLGSSVTPRMKNIITLVLMTQPSGMTDLRIGFLQPKALPNPTTGTLMITSVVIVRVGIRTVAEGMTR